jgi:hypothetical protein
MLSHIDASNFDWLSWRQGNPHLLFGASRGELATPRFAQFLRRYAIGYCDGSVVPCRPKVGFNAVMFQIDSRNGDAYLGWCHLSHEEFEKVFR